MISAASARSVGSVDISIEHQGAKVNFRSTDLQEFTVVAEQKTFANFTVQEGSPAFFISAVRPAATRENLFELAFEPISIEPTSTKQLIGVYSPTLPTSSAKLRITGDGITYGKTTFNSDVFVGYNLMTVEIP